MEIDAEETYQDKVDRIKAMDLVDEVEELAVERLEIEKAWDDEQKAKKHKQLADSGLTDLRTMEDRMVAIDGMRLSDEMKQELRDIVEEEWEEQQKEKEKKEKEERAKELLGRGEIYERRKGYILHVIPKKPEEEEH